MSVLNLELLFNVYKIIFVLSAALNQISMLAFAPLFFVIFGLVLLKRPYYCYENQVINRAIISAVAFTCLIRVVNAILSRPIGNGIL